MGFKGFTKLLFGRKQATENILDVIDGEIIDCNEGHSGAISEEPGLPSENQKISFEKQEFDPDFQEPEFTEPDFQEPSPPEKQIPEKVEIEPREDRGPWDVPGEYILYMAASKKADRTINEYSWDLKWWDRQKDIHFLTHTDIERVISKLNPSTARRKIAALKSYAKWLLREGNGFLYSEVGQIIPPKLPDRVPKDRGDDAFRDFTGLAKELCDTGDRRGIWLGLMLCCGVRISEVATVERAPGNTIKVTGKGNKERLIPAPSWLLDAISKDYGYGNKWKLSRSLIWLKLKDMEVKKPHSLRHTYASQLIRSDFALEEVQKLLGHKKIDTTLVYARVNVPKNVTNRLGVEF
jgi:site-specific recombinase XerD